MQELPLACLRRAPCPREIVSASVMSQTHQLSGSEDSAADNAAFFTPEYLEKRRRAMTHAGELDLGDSLDFKLPSGHAYGVRLSSRLTSDFRRQHCRGAMDITPQDVIDALNSGGVKT